MTIDIAYVLAALIGAGIIFVGINQLVRPRDAAGFGIPGTPVECAGGVAGIRTGRWAGLTARLCSPSMGTSGAIQRQACGPNPSEGTRRRRGEHPRIFSWYA